VDPAKQRAKELAELKNALASMTDLIERQTAELAGLKASVDSFRKLAEQDSVSLAELKSSVDSLSKRVENGSSSESSAGAKKSSETPKPFADPVAPASSDTPLAPPVAETGKRSEAEPVETLVPKTEASASESDKSDKPAEKAKDTAGTETEQADKPAEKAKDTAGTETEQAEKPAGNKDEVKRKTVYAPLLPWLLSVITFALIGLFLGALIPDKRRPLKRPADDAEKA
jgi:ElaB/YqjD/DUF883 family membrane-anchored ribosome-binding protein